MTSEHSGRASCGQPLERSAKRCIVTGGAGFIGSHLVERLVTDGHSVTVLDNLSNGRQRNLANVLPSGRVQFIQADVSDYSAIKDHFTGADWVFHLAALADIVPSVQEPLKYHRSNIDGTAAVLEAARSARVRRFMYAASSSCYGLAEQFPTPESAPVRPMYPYALTKWVGEQMALHWHQVFGMPVVSLRLFNVYGPRSRTSGNYGAVMGVFLGQKLAGKPLTIVGDGKQTRDFTYVSDVAGAFAAAAASDVAGETFNVGSGNTYAVNHLAKLIGGETVHIPKRPGEPDCTFADIARIKSMLGWRPEVSFEEGVARVLQHIGDWRDAPVWTPETIAEATRPWFEFVGGKRPA